MLIRYFNSQEGEKQKLGNRGLGSSFRHRAI